MGKVEQDYNKRGKGEIRMIISFIKPFPAETRTAWFQPE